MITKFYSNVNILNGYIIKFTFLQHKSEINVIFLAVSVIK